MHNHAPARRRDALLTALSGCRRHFIAAGLFSAGSNLLLLVPTLYMLQVYARVLPTGSVLTLALISAVALFALVVLALLDWLRARLLVRAGVLVETDLAPHVIHAAIARADIDRMERADALRQFETLRQAVSSPGVLALFDAPWTIVYLAVAFMLHWALGVMALVASIVHVAISWRHERAIEAPLTEAATLQARAGTRHNHALAHAGDIRALGIARALVAQQTGERADFATAQAATALLSGNYASASRFLVLVLQSAALGLGALLAVDGAVSAGAVFAGSLVMGRALAPLDRLNQAWKTLASARRAYHKLGELLAAPPRATHTRLPDPSGELRIERLTVLAPQADRVAIADVSALIAPGVVVGLVGPSGAGKSTLLRALAGGVTPARGTVRLDGAALDDWDPEQLARHIGYLPQSFALFPGTVKDNISRFATALGEDPATVDAAVVAAAQSIGAHEMILRLPQGYDTLIGPGEPGFSAGQAQRIALARALYGKPRLLLLDEPTAHLDDEAMRAFAKQIAIFRQEKRTVVIATHSADLLSFADRMMLLVNGRVERFGPIVETAVPLRPVSHVSAS